MRRRIGRKEAEGKVAQREETSSIDPQDILRRVSFKYANSALVMFFSSLRILVS